MEWWISMRPKGGRGEKVRLAQKLSISAALFSQILGGERTFSPEAALQMAEELTLNEKETDYFLRLVDHSRAGSAKLRDRLMLEIRERQKESKKVASRVVSNMQLTPEMQATYYSSWTYTGVRNLSAVPGFDSIDKIAERLSLPKGVIARVIEFLLETGLCRIEDGRITYGPAWTHVAGDAKLAMRHHQNWRVRALTQMELMNQENLFYTAPMSLSDEASTEIRKLLLSAIESAQKISSPSPSETVRCLNLDWFEY